MIASTNKDRLLKLSPPFLSTVQGDISGCLKPPVDFNFITGHVNSGGKLLKFRSQVRRRSQTRASTPTS